MSGRGLLFGVLSVLILMACYSGASPRRRHNSQRDKRNDRDEAVGRKERGSSKNNFGSSGNSGYGSSNNNFGSSGYGGKSNSFGSSNNNFGNSGSGSGSSKNNFGSSGNSEYGSSNNFGSSGFGNSFGGGFNSGPDPFNSGGGYGSSGGFHTGSPFDSGSSNKNNNNNNYGSSNGGFHTGSPFDTGNNNNFGSSGGFPSFSSPFNSGSASPSSSLSSFGFPSASSFSSFPGEDYYDADCTTSPDGKSTFCGTHSELEPAGFAIGYAAGAKGSTATMGTGTVGANGTKLEVTTTPVKLNATHFRMRRRKGTNGTLTKLPTAIKIVNPTTAPVKLPKGAVISKPNSPPKKG